jgi:integrase
MLEESKFSNTFAHYKMLKLFGVCLNLEFFIFPDQTGTATSSPLDLAASPIFTVCWSLKREGYADSTIEATNKRLKNLSRHVNLKDPEQVKTYIASRPCSNGFKESLAEAYDHYVKFQGLTWSKPFFQRYDKQPKIPSEQRVEMLIAYANLRMALVLSLMRDLGTRPIELTWLKLKDFDLETGVVNITTAKFGVGRTLKVKSATLAMLKMYVVKKNTGLNDRVFPVKSNALSESYRKLRNNLAVKLQDPTFKSIRLYDFRHFRASKEYHRTKDLLYVKAFLGHTDLRSTLKYIQLVNFGDDGYFCKVAKTVAEASELIEAGFDYVMEIDGLRLFRKPK